MVDTTFEGANADVLLIDDSANTIKIEANYRFGDVHRVTFNTGISGYSTGVPLKIQIRNTNSWQLPVLAAYSYDQVNWTRIGGTYLNDYKEYADTFQSGPLYFATGYPYQYSDMLSLAGSITGLPHVTVSTIAISEHGRDVKLFRFAEPCVPDSNKVLIWLLGRSHAMESHSSYVIDGLSAYLASGDAQAENLRRRATVFIIPMMDVDMVYAGGTGKEQNPVDFNRDWDSPSYWNAIIGAKNMMLQSNLFSPMTIFIDSHNPFPGQNGNNTWFFSMYATGPKSDNLDFYRKLYYSNAGHPVNRQPAYTTNGQTARAWTDSIFPNVDFSVTLETGWVDRTDNVEWTIPLYRLHGENLGRALSDYVANMIRPSDIILDTEDSAGVTVTGQWNTSTFYSGFWGSHYMHDDNTGQGTKSVLFSPSIPSGGIYEVFLRYTADQGRADSVPVTISYSGGVRDTHVNQQARGAEWVSVGFYPFAGGNTGSVLIENNGTSGYVIADAVRFSPYDTCGTTPVSTMTPAGEDMVIRALPNPGTGIFHLQSTLAGDYALAVFNTLGRQVWSSTRTGINGQTVDLSREPDGMYLLSGQSRTGRVALKLLKQQ